MRRLLALALLSTTAAIAVAGEAAVPTVFAPGVISSPADEGAAAFAPDGATVYFMRGGGAGWTILESHRQGTQWSPPQPAPFSGRWHDLDPAMAPDGSYLLFVSNRPASGTGAPIDEVFGGRSRAGEGMNLWRVDRHGNGWGTPVRLPDTVNTCSTTFAPSVAADGNVYFIGCAGNALRLLRARCNGTRCETPQRVALGSDDAKIRDPAIAPDGSFIVFSITRAKQPLRLAIAFGTPQGWSAPRDLGDAVNAGAYSMGAQLGPGGRTLYFYSNRRVPAAGADAGWNNGGDNLWQVSLAPWLDAADRPGVARTEPLAAGPWAAVNDASPAFTPDGRTVVFSRGEGAMRRLYVADRQGPTWGAPVRAPFSDRWMDLEPAMAPDGRYLVFVSNRPAQPGGAPLDGGYGGKLRPGRGGHLWRVARTAHGWGTPQRLPDDTNASTSVYAPAVAADGSLYFMQPDSTSGAFRLYRSRFAGGRLQPPQPLPFSDGTVADMDPAVAPDQSFVVFSSARPPATASASALFVAFAHGDGWSAPMPLGRFGVEARLSADRATLYYSGTDRRIHSMAFDAWLQQHAGARP